MAISARSVGAFVISCFLLIPGLAFAQESKSAPLAAELCKLLDEKKMDSIAAQEATDQYVGALYFSGAQLLVVKGKFPGAARMNDLLTKKDFKEVYMDLSSATDAQSRAFIMDLGANGLRFKRENDQPFDTADLGGKTFKFDGEWSKAKLSEDEYRKTYTQTDDDYAKMLQALITALKKPS